MKIGSKWLPSRRYILKNKAQDFSIVNKELAVDGIVSSRGRLIVKGEVKGKIIGENLIIAEEGSVYANAEVVSMTIGGIFEGEIKASKELIILSTGKCSGKIICKNLVVEAGGFLNAQVTCLVAEDSNSEIGDIK
jgi:cytoskeletal protein CcmA (bactofilin family)